MVRYGCWFGSDGRDNMNTATVTAQAVSRALRASGFCPTQPSRIEPAPPLYVIDSAGSVQVRIDTRRARFTAADIVAALAGRGYVGAVDEPIMGQVTVRVTR
jgi:hypothetical protein